MAAAVAPIFGIAGRHSGLVKTTLGWVGSKAGARGAFVTVDSSGYIDQAAAASNAVSTVRVGILVDDVASTVAAASTNALAVGYRPWTEDTEVELPLVTNSDTFITVTGAYVGDKVGIYRRTTGDYAFDTNGTGYGRIIRVNTTRGTVTCVPITSITLP